MEREIKSAIKIVYDEVHPHRILPGADRDELRLVTKEERR
jgi:hypothetical protein